QPPDQPRQATVEMFKVKGGPRPCCVRSRRALCVVGVDAIESVAEAAGDCLAADLRLIAVDLHAVHVGKRKARGGQGLSGGSDVPVPDGREFKAARVRPGGGTRTFRGVSRCLGIAEPYNGAPFECGQLVVLR
ncbi:MAG TPA: hypothetical protein VE155_06315, partial [Pseudonocardiaceae bacterium]|nr:hypothetical protein [Pseudonocardiaceae bacterium]